MEETQRLVAETDDLRDDPLWFKDAVFYEIYVRGFVFGRGTMRFVKPESRKIFAFVREYDSETVLCVFNLSQFAQPVELDLAEFEGRAPVEMPGKTRFPAVTAQAYQLALSPFGFYWFRIEESSA